MRNRCLTALTAVCLVCCGLAANAATAFCQTPVRFAFQNRIGSVLPIIADQQGFFEQQGLTMKILRFSSGPACAEALYSGSADIATMGDTSAIIALSRALPLQIITSHASGEHRHRVMVMNPAIDNLAALRGKRIGVKKGTSTYGGLLRLLDEAAIKPTQVRLIDLPPATQIEALQAGSIDALAASEPTPAMAEMKGARQLATLGGLGNNYPVLIMAHQNFCRQHPQQLVSFLAALRQALHFLQQHPAQAQQLIAEALGLPVDVTRNAMQRHRYQLDYDDEIRASLSQTARFLHQQRIISRLPALHESPSGNTR